MLAVAWQAYAFRFSVRKGKKCANPCNNENAGKKTRQSKVLPRDRQDNTAIPPILTVQYTILNSHDALGSCREMWTI